jgi:hypothetical protein
LKEVHLNTRIVKNKQLFLSQILKKPVMKKFAPIVAIAVLGMMFTSCKKSYNCVCVDSAGTEVSNSDYSNYKSTAKTLCAASNSAMSISGGSCELK